MLIARIRVSIGQNAVWTLICKRKYMYEYVEGTIMWNTCIDFFFHRRTNNLYMWSIVYIIKKQFTDK